MLVLCEDAGVHSAGEVKHSQDCLLKSEEGKAVLYSFFSAPIAAFRDCLLLKNSFHGSAFFMRLAKFAIVKLVGSSEVFTSFQFSGVETGA